MWQSGHDCREPRSNVCWIFVFIGDKIVSSWQKKKIEMKSMAPEISYLGVTLTKVFFVQFHHKIDFGPKN